MFHHLVADGETGTVQHALRGDERHDAAVAHTVQCLQEEVVVYALRRRLPAVVMAQREGRVEHRHVAKRNVGDGQVKVVVEGLLNLLKALHTHLLVRVQLAEYRTRQQVFLKRHHINTAVVPPEGIHEGTASGRRLQHRVRAHLVLMQHVGNGLRNRLWRVEGRQYRCFQAVHMLLVLTFTARQFLQHPVELEGRGKQFTLRFRPLCGIRQFPCRIEDAFQTAETAILLHHGTLFCRGCSSLAPQGQGCPYRLDITGEPRLTVKRHTPRCKGRRHPSVRYTGHRTPSTG